MRNAGLVALRIVDEKGTPHCEKFESGNWNNLAPFRLAELSSDSVIKNWLNEHNQTAKKEVAEKDAVKILRNYKKTKKKVTLSFSK